MVLEAAHKPLSAAFATLAGPVPSKSTIDAFFAEFANDPWDVAELVR